MRFGDAVAAPTTAALSSHGASRTAWWWHGANDIGTATSAGIVRTAFIVWNAVTGPATIGNTGDRIGGTSRRHSETINITRAATRIWIHGHAGWRALTIRITLFHTGGARCTSYRCTSRLLIRNTLHIASSAADRFTRIRITREATIFTVRSRTTFNGATAWILVRNAVCVAAIHRWRCR